MLDAVEQAEDVAAVARSVRAWAKAWSERNIDAYVASYEAGFRTAGQSHEGWVALRTRRIQGARRIAVDLQQLRVSLNGDEAYVRFRQHYTSDRHTAVDEKALMLRRDERGTWLIARELVRPPTVDTSTAETPAVHVGPGVTSRS